MVSAPSCLKGVKVEIIAQHLKPHLSLLENAERKMTIFVPVIQEGHFLICFTGYQLHMGYLIQAFDSFVNVRLRKERERFGLIYLFNDISVPNGLFKTEILSISKYLIIIITRHIFNVQLQSFFLIALEF